MDTAMDTAPTTVIKSCAETFSLLIARLAALSFDQGRFPTKYKLAVVTPLLKKEGLDDDVFAKLSTNIEFKHDFQNNRTFIHVETGRIREEVTEL